MIVSFLFFTYYSKKTNLSVSQFTINPLSIDLVNCFNNTLFDTLISALQKNHYQLVYIVHYFHLENGVKYLYKQYDKAVLYLQNQKLDMWTQNKMIQKTIES